MNYSRSINKRSIAKRVLISWLIVAIIFTFAGILIGSVLSHDSGKAMASEAETENEVLFYMN